MNTHCKHRGVQFRRGIHNFKNQTDYSLINWSNALSTSSHVKQFNVVHVMADQHHAGLMGCAGHQQVITPNLDAFAAIGMRFTNAYCQNPICTPSRVSTLSGQYCHNHGYFGLSGPAHPQLPSWLGHFKLHGYRTGAFGKLHLPNEPKNWIGDHVDDFGDCYEQVEGGIGRSRFLDELDRDGIRHLEDSWHNHSGHYSQSVLPQDARPSDMPYERTHERWSVQQAMHFIDQAPDEPFCVHISFQKPHHPLFPQRQFWDMYDEDLSLPETIDVEPAHRPPHFVQAWQHMRNRQWEYAQPGQTWRDGARRAWRGTLACITQIDDVFGILIQELKNRQLYDNTIIIYHSDHGCYHGIHGIVEKAPGICSDAVCRVPMIWRVPGLTQSDSISEQLVELVDVADTLTAICDLPAMTTTDGRSLKGLLAGTNEPVREVAVTENPWSKSIRFGDWRLVHYQPQMFDGQDVGELYNMAIDPNEMNNLYHDTKHQHIVHQARHLLLQWLIQTTRHCTVFPTMRPRRGGYNDYDIVEDGMESNVAGSVQRVNAGRLNYL